MKQLLGCSVAIALLGFVHIVAAQESSDDAVHDSPPVEVTPATPTPQPSVATPPSATPVAISAPPPTATLPPGTYVWIGPPPLSDRARPGVVGVPLSGEPVDATTRRARNAVYLELGGNGIVASMNYERFLTDDLSVRAGVGYLSAGDSTVDGTSASLTTIPLMLNYLGIGSGSNRLELGAGVVFLHMSAHAYDGYANEFGSGSLLAATGCVAYRYAPLDGGFNFKVGFHPLISSFGVIPVPGVSLGAIF